MSSGPAYDAKEQVRQAVDIVDLVGGYLTLRRQGRGYVGLCPWHDDSRPSLQVNSERQIWRCFVCGDGGDVFSFVMKREGVDFREALEMLADRAGIQLTRSPREAPQPGSPADKRTLYRVAAWAEQQFHNYLLRAPEAEIARRYLEDRGFTPETVERFQIGYAPNEWQWLIERAKATPFSAQVLEAVGLVRQHAQSGRYYDYFRGRVVFSIRDTEDRAIAFGGRILPEIAAEIEQSKGDPPAKYLNSPDTRLFSKSDQLYALNVVRGAVAKSRQIVVVEGYTDAVMAWQAGLDNVTAVLGTALGERHIRLLRRFADSVTLVLDGDEAGQRRTNEILELFVAADVDLRILTLPQGVDPCDYLHQQGGDPFRAMLDGAADALEHKIGAETRGIDLARETHRAGKALENILATIAKAPRLSAGSSSSTRLREQQILARLSRQFHLPEAELRARLSELRRKTKRSGSTSTGQTAVQTDIDPAELELIELLVLAPGLSEAAVHAIASQQIASPLIRGILDTYRRLYEEGRSLDFSDVLTELTDADLKSYFVRIEQHASDKSEHAQASPAERLDGLLQVLQQRQSESERRSKLAALQQQRFNEQEELDILQQLIEQERTRQGISAPTDG